METLHRVLTGQTQNLRQLRIGGTIVFTWLTVEVVWFTMDVLQFCGIDGPKIVSWFG